MNKITEIFSKNLYRLRKQMNLTQEQLGEQINYSEKAISKWERGDCIPPAETLIMLANLFNVQLDDLLNYGNEPTYYLGIDGGAVQTLFALVSADGAQKRVLKLGPSNPMDGSFDKVKELLTTGIRQITRGIPLRKISLFAGLSGGSLGGSLQTFSQFFEEFGFCRCKCGSNARNLLACSFGENDGVGVIMGAGISAFIQKSGEITRIGGLGYLFDQGGSGYDIGCEVIRSACMMEDGTGEETLLREYLLKERGTQTVLENIPYFYEIGKKGIASYAPFAFEAYRKKDAVATKILDRNMQHVARLLTVARRKLDKGEEKMKVVLDGILMEYIEILMPMIEKNLDAMDDLKYYDISVNTKNVVYGALLLAGIDKNVQIDLSSEEVSKP